MILLVAEPQCLLKRAALRLARTERAARCAERMDIMGFKEEFSALKGTFKLDSRFGKVFLWEALLIIALIIGVWVWADSMESLTPLLQQLSQPYSSDFSLPGSLTMQNTGQVAEELKFRMTLYIGMIVAYLLVIWPFFKSKAYTALLNKKMDLQLYWRFILAELGWTALLVLVFYIIQYAFYKTVFYDLPYKASARITLLVGSVLVFLILCYFTITFFISFTKMGKFRAGLRYYLDVPIKKIRNFLISMLFTLLVFLVLNILIRVVKLLPEKLAFVLVSVIVLGYIVWLKVYYCDCIVRNSHVEKNHAAAKPAVEHSHSKAVHVKKRN
jgi:hypothetical protein